MPAPHYLWFNMERRRLSKRKKNGVNNNHIKRAHKFGAEVIDTSVNVHELFDRDEGICSLCGGRVYTKHVSMDHVIPLSRGGNHSWDNVKLAHNKCNKQKGY